MKLHYVYYAIQKNGKPKYGATTEPSNRKNREKYKSIKVLEEFKCPLECGDREIELQIKYLGKRDSSTHYADMILRRDKLKLPLIRKKISENTKKALSTPEVRKKLSLKSTEMWKDPKRKEKNVRGVSQHLSKLTPELVKQIRKEYIPRKVSSRKLANKYNVNQKSILNIVNRVTWKHIN
jgi:ribosomal protein S25